jgi:uncharacterized protein
LPAPGTVKVDITISERIVLPLEDETVLQSYAEFSDLPRNREVRVYSLGEIVTVKIVALSDRARTEPRDLYDAWHLTNDRDRNLRPYPRNRSQARISRTIH